jgi:hypothetical protein
MITTTEVPMIQRHTPNFIVCPVCKISNNFLIEVVEQKGDYYYMERCPRERCNHTEEIRLINGREAKKYIDVPAEDPFAQ